MKEIFIQKLKETLDLSYRDDINEDTEIEKLEWDSLATLSAFVLIQDMFGKTVEAKKIRQCNTIKDIYLLAEEH